MRFELKHTFNAPVDAVAKAMLDAEYLKYLRENHALVLEAELLSFDDSNEQVRRSVRYRTKPVIEKIGKKKVPPEWFAFAEESTYDKNRYELSFENVPTIEAIRNLLINRGTVTLYARGPALTERVTSGELKLALPFLLRPLAVIGERLIYIEASKLLDQEAKVMKQWLEENS